MEHVRIGSRVYYKGEGPHETGTIIDIVLDEWPFVVKWDDQLPSEYLEIPNELRDIGEAMGLDVSDVPFTHTYNPADENIDRFKAGQLVLIEY